MTRNANFENQIENLLQYNWINARVVTQVIYWYRFNNWKTYVNTSRRVKLSIAKEATNMLINFIRNIRGI